MNRGRIYAAGLGIEFDIESIGSSASQKTLAGDHEWAYTCRVKDTSPEKEIPYARGVAMLREEVEEDSATVDDAGDTVSVKSSTEFRHRAKFGHWLILKGGWMVATDDWVRTVASQAVIDYPTRVELDLRGFLDDFAEPSVYQLGFRGRNVGEGGEKGALYGSHVDEDPDLGRELSHTPLNELGVKHRHETTHAKAYLAAGTGYVEAYEDWDTGEFVDYLSKWVLHHAKTEDIDDEESEVCEGCGREPEKGLHEGPDGRELCITCLDKVEAEAESRATRKLDQLDSVTVTDGGESDG
ncbi:hypothetical protein [Halorussus halobius]|uniref:hypothetical protein n=1 Tax=Halorussus halobius TaxID=1710537 RepID=UPI001091CA0C|nr:hypothetical protein [Halorussus halobius]